MSPRIERVVAEIVEPLASEPPLAHPRRLRCAHFVWNAMI